MGYETPDRTIHGRTADGDPIVRYDRSGKWYVEPEAGRRTLLTVSQAAELAVAGTAVAGRQGGQAFDAKVAKLRRASTD